jgi:hypothetical protein
MARSLAHSSDFQHCAAIDGFLPSVRAISLEQVFRFVITAFDYMRGLSLGNLFESLKSQTNKISILKVQAKHSRIDD